MSFLNATLLAGMLAAAVPIVLHLLARQQPRHVVFPGVAFLKSRVTAQKSRLKIRRWWLLALRILAVVAFAMVLARPHIDATMSSAWTTIGLIGFAAMGLLVMASIAFSKEGSRWLPWTLLIASIVAWLIAGVGAVTSLAGSTPPDLTVDRPVALAIVIDNSPGLSWRVDRDSLNSVGSSSVVSEEVGSGENASLSQSSQSTGATRRDVAIRRAGELIDRLASGSRLAVIDRSDSPVGFSLDVGAARSRLSRIEPIASPSPIADRIEEAMELVRTSDLPDRHVVVITDLAELTWSENAPVESASSRLNEQNREGVALTVFDLRPHSPKQVGSTEPGNKKNLFNRSLSLPRLVDTAAAPGVAIPIVLDVETMSPNASGPSSNNGVGDTDISATVQLSLYENDPTLPVVRDGSTVTPKLRTVDRASVSLSVGKVGSGSQLSSENQRVSGIQSTEVVLTLPPLPRGNYHAVVELVGEDQFIWDNRRYLSIEIPEPPRVLLVGDDREETNVLAAAMTAPHDIDDPAAAYQVDVVGYGDLAAVNWRPFDVVMMIDPPVRYSKAHKQWSGSTDGLSETMLDQLRDLVSRGGGLWIGLGPASELLTKEPLAGKANGDGKNSASQSKKLALVPPLVRAWRIPTPGTFLHINDSSHPIFAPLSRPSSSPNWSDFRIRRYWQTDSEGWNTLARYADHELSDSHSAVLVRDLNFLKQSSSEQGFSEQGKGRIVVTTTPLPALSQATRNWNDLYGGSDAWPAFMTTRSMTAWLAGRQRTSTTLIVGQTAVLPLPARSISTSPSPSTAASPLESDAATTWKVYPPDQLPKDVRLSRGLRSVEGQDAAIVVSETTSPGTYFLRNFGRTSDVLASDDLSSKKIQPTGFSTNLAAEWSRDAIVDPDVMEKWFGHDETSPTFSVVDSVDALSLATGGSASAISLHGPLMLLALMLFLGEQLLSNRFYGNTDRDRSLSPALAEAS